MSKKNKSKSSSAATSAGKKQKQQRQQQQEPKQNPSTKNNNTKTITITTTSNSSSSSSNNNLRAILLGIFIALVAIAYGIIRQIHANREMIGNVVSNKTAFTPTLLQPYQQFFGSVIAGNNDVNTTHLREQWNNLRRSIEVASSSSSLQNATAIGRRLAAAVKKDDDKEGGGGSSYYLYKAKHPVFLVPGFVTSGLELWEGKECAHEQYFRRKIWGSLETFRSFMQDTECWKQHLSLDPITGKDPEGIRLRPSQGFEAADFWTRTTTRSDR